MGFDREVKKKKIVFCQKLFLIYAISNNLKTLASAQNNAFICSF